MLSQVGAVEDVVADVATATIITVVVVLLVVLVVGSIALRAARYWSLRSLASGQDWRWVGRSPGFARLVLSAPVTE